MGLQRFGHDLVTEPQKQGDIWKYLETFFSCRIGGELLGFNEWRSEMLLNIPHYTGQPSATKDYLTSVSKARFRSLRLHILAFSYSRIQCKFLAFNIEL